MSKFRFLNILLSLVVAMVFFSTLTQAKDIKSRMKERIPTIKALKAKGIIGENNKGYLEFLGNKISNKDVVDAQNQDRKKVYSGIAKQQGTTAAVVGKRRAKQKRNKAKSGAWIQKEKGEWHQKK